VVTRPFSFEGTNRARTAKAGIETLLKYVDTLIIIPNDRLLGLCTHHTSVGEAFVKADEVLQHGVQAITEVITVPGLINLDFADVRTIMKNAGPAWISIGTGRGADRAVNAAQAALASPLLEGSLKGATGVLFNISAGTSLSLFEVNKAAEIYAGNSIKKPMLSSVSCSIRTWMMMSDSRLWQPVLPVHLHNKWPIKTSG
jgi:cell division protein FtsZ